MTRLDVYRLGVCRANLVKPETTEFGKKETSRVRETSLVHWYFRVLLLEKRVSVKAA